MADTTLTIYQLRWTIERGGYVEPTDGPEDATYFSIYQQNAEGFHDWVADLPVALALALKLQPVESFVVTVTPGIPGLPISVTVTQQ